MAYSHDPLPPLRDVIASHGLQANRAFGQNFILDLNVTQRIANAAGPLVGEHIIEIGPGPGGLTRSLLMADAGRVSVIEADKRFRPVLEDIAKAFPGRLDIIMGDARKLNLHDIAPQNYKIVSNLPYHIATPLLIAWLKQKPIGWQSLTLMFQKEVADRICATAGDKAYGRLGVLANWLCETRPLFDVPAQVFVPPPNVVSSVIQLCPRKKPLAEADIDWLERLTAAAFGQRRKMLRVSLKQLSPEPVRLLQQAGIAETARAENVQIEEFCTLARLLAQQSPAAS